MPAAPARRAPMTPADSPARRMARLARLRPAAAEMARLERDLEAILEFFAQLAEAPVDAAAPLAHPLELEQRLRADQADEPDRRADYQALAPQVRDGLYRVPAVLDAE